MCVMGHKVQVSFTDEQWELVSKIRGSMGKSDADVVRNIVLAWLSEKSIISTNVKEQMKKASKSNERG